MPMYHPIAQDRADRYRLSVEQYVTYQRDGYIVIRGLVPMNEVEELRTFAMDLLYGLIDVPDVPRPDFLGEKVVPKEKLYSRFSRIHMLHRVHEIAERYLLHPKVLDVLEGLIGPDVLALQTMLFLNPPGKGGQGWHQDAYYISTYPDTLIGAWIALDRADLETGCLRFVPGSNNEPIHPSEDEKIGWVHADGAFTDLKLIRNASKLDDETNTLTPIVRSYGEPVPCIAEPGDVVFFQGHIFHRSTPNAAQERMRRSFVCHYCNARSWVPWNHGRPWEGDAANYLHILARGQTHLPFAKPVFGTPCAALAQEPSTAPAAAMPAMGDAGIHTA
jgi:phytanoyl-CoA hydroxylase